MADISSINILVYSGIRCGLVSGIVLVLNAVFKMASLKDSIDFAGDQRAQGLAEPKSALAVRRHTCRIGSLDFDTI